MNTHTRDEAFRCDVERDRDRVIIRPAGEVDLATAPIVEQAMAEARGSGFAHIILDLRQVTFLDSSGLRLLIAWSQSAKEDDFRLGIVPDAPAVLRLLELTDALRQLPIVAADGLDIP
jgi:anti-sigma B factor antagonist